MMPMLPTAKDSHGGLVACPQGPASATGDPPLHSPLSILLTLALASCAIDAPAPAVRPWSATGQVPASGAAPATLCPDDPTLTLLWADGARVTSAPLVEHVLRVRDCGFDPPRQLVAPGDRLRLGNDRTEPVVVVAHSGTHHVEIPLPPRWSDAHWIVPAGTHHLELEGTTGTATIVAPAGPATVVRGASFELGPLAPGSRRLDTLGADQVRRWVPVDAGSPSVAAGDWRAAIE